MVTSVVPVMESPMIKLVNEIGREGLWELEWIVKVSIFFYGCVLCLVLKCARARTHTHIPLFLPAVVPYLWWQKCLFCNAFGLIQCGLWWVSQRFSSWFVTVWHIECSLYGFSSIVHAGFGWTMGKIIRYFRSIINAYSLLSHEW